MPDPPDPKLGTTVSHYRIVAPLGAGGMGVVYQAEDLKLGRAVALKFLSSDMAREPGAIERFEREARTASALNHPGICTIHDFEVHDTQPFIVMELLEGETLRSRIKAGPIPPGEVVTLALQIADALGAAHTRGIVHRDIKPANIFLTPSGQAKLLDFGLARPTLGLDAELTAAPTTGRPQTTAGTTLGTLGYMSPEQALGQVVDIRSDLFSLGATLYEALTREPAFGGTTAAAVYDAILHAMPAPLTTLAPAIDADLQDAVMRLLAKDREHRYQTPVELAADLRRIGYTSTASSSGRTATVPAAARRTPRFLPWLAGAVGIGAVLGTVYWPRSVEPTAPAPPTPTLTYAQVTLDGLERYPGLSPDGRSVVFASHRSGDWDVYAQRIGGRNAVNLTEDSPGDDTHPVFSPDGQTVAFRSSRLGGGIFVMGATGESARRVSDLGFHPAWSPDGRRLVVSSEAVTMPDARGANSSLWILDLTAGTRRQLTTGDAVQAAWSPDGARVAYWGVQRGRRDIWTVAVDGGEPEAITSDAALDWNPRWSPDGQFLYFASDRGGTMNLWRVRIDQTTGRAEGSPDALTTPASFLGDLSLSADGQRLVYVDLRVVENIHKAPLGSRRREGASTPITRGLNRFVLSDVSADGQWLAAWTRGVDGDLYLLSADGATVRRLTDDRYVDRVGRWSADGRRLLFHSNRTGDSQLWSIDVNGEGLRQLARTAVGVIYPAQSPDGTRIAYSQYGREAYLAEVGDNLSVKSETALPRPGEGEAFVPWAWSADGQYLAGWSALTDGRIGGLMLFAPRTRQYTRIETSIANAALPTWLTGDQLVFGDEHKAYRYDVRTKTVTELWTPTGFDVLNPIPSKDGQWLFFTLVTRESSVWLAELK